MAASSSAPSTPTFSPIVKYALLVLAAIAALVATYWLQLAPDAVGFAGSGAAIVGLFTFATADLEQDGDPPKLPRGTTFVVVTGLVAVYGAVGAFTAQTLSTWAAFLTWLVIVLEYVLTTFRAQLDQYVPSAYDTWIVAGVGIVLAIVQFLAANPTASLDSIVVTGIVSLASFINNSSSPTAPPSTGASPPSSSTVPVPAPAGAPTASN